MRVALPLRAAGKNGPKDERFGDRIAGKDIKSPADFQTLGGAATEVVALHNLRARHVARRYRLTPAVAAIVADLAFTTREAAR